MKRFFSMLVAASAMSACVGNEGTTQPPTPIDWGKLSTDGGASWIAQTAATPAVKSTLSQLQLGAIQRFADAFLSTDRKNLPKIMSAPGELAKLYTAEATLVIPGLVDVKGRDAIAKAYQGIYGAFSPFKISAARIYQHGDIVAIEWAAVGGPHREWMGVPPVQDPDPVSFAGLTLLDFDAEGLIRMDHTYFDVIGILTQLGAAPRGYEKQRFATLEGLTAAVFSAKGTDQEKRNAEVPKQLADAIARKSEGEYLARVSDDIMHVGVNGVTRGRDAEKRRFQRLFTAFSDLRIKDETFGVEDFVIDEFEASATNTGPLGPFPATKKPVTWRGAEIYQLKDGKVTRLTAYVNRLELLTKLGLFKFPITK